MRLALLPVAIFIRAAASIAEAQSIYGVFQDCPFHCRTIKINRNGTFVYRLNGDLYNDQRHSGTWTLVDRNKLHASSSLNRSALQVIEKRRSDSANYLVSVLDPNGAGVKGAVIAGRLGRNRFSVTTDDAGQAQIPKCHEFRLAFSDYRGKHGVLNPAAREFTVILTLDQMENWAINETWLIEGNRLYIAAKDGTFDRDYWLDRLSSEQARKIFR